MADEFTQMRTQWRSMQVAEGYDASDPTIAAVLARITSDAQTWWDKLDKSAGRTFLWDDARLDVDQSFAISRSFGRLYSMALAWATPGSGLAADAGLVADTIAGLDWMVEHYYREDGEIIGNWYEWQISGPMAFNDAVLLLYGRLSDAQIGAYTRAVANFTPAPSGTAANRALTANVVVGRGVLAGDPDAVATGIAGLPPVLTYVKSGDGFYIDGSFIQHDYFPYLGGYGALILESLGPIMTTVAGTQWAVDGSILYRWLHEAFEPVIWNGALFDLVSGRTIARWNEHEHYHAHYVLQAAIGLIAGAPADEKERLRALLKEWLLSDTYDDPTPTRTIPVLLAATQLRDDDTVKRRGRLVGSWVFHNEDRVVHRRPEWALGISMYSSRIANYESINGENLRGWLTADGATYLYRRVSDQYQEDFWATVDHSRIPGTTVDVRERAASEDWYHRSPNSWVGGACLGGRYTAAGMDLNAEGSTLTARKSWFCFDSEVVALGAGITASDGRPVETVVENRRIAGPEKALVDGSPVVPAPGDAASAERVRWLHLAETGGYVFVSPTSLELRRDVRTGAWTDVTTHPNWAKPDPITRTYLTATVPHGVDPGGESYAYILLPAATPVQTASYAANPPVKVVANTDAVQAVRCHRPDLLAANFWRAGTADIVTATGPMSVLVKRGAGEAEIAVSDPSRTTAPASATVRIAAAKVVAADAGVTVTSLDPLTFAADFADDPGATKTLRVALRKS
ncbi:polysaccharide lyase 8 family protein [Flindersiella endophytica]